MIRSGFSEAAGGADDGAIVDLKDHPLEALVEVDGVVRWIEGAAGLDVAGAIVVDVLRRWEAATGAEHRRCRQRVASRQDGHIRV